MNVAQTRLMAQWLAENVNAIAASEAAGETYRDVKRLTHDIERRINRPHPLRSCGPCPAPRNADQCAPDCDRRHPHQCDRALLARHGKREITCPECKTAHNVEDLIAKLINEQEDKRFTVRELLDVVLPRLDEHVPRSTLYYWIGKGKIPAVGRDGAPRRSGKDDELMVRLADVRAMRAQRSRKVSA